MNTPFGTSVLFICSGNIFRSMTAEYALRACLDEKAALNVRSAGLVEAPHEIVDFVRDYLAQRAIDISAHVPRRLDPGMLAGADLAVAMDVTHRQRVEANFGRRLPLFSEVAQGVEVPMPDVDEVVDDWRNNPAEAIEYGHAVMDRIFDGMPGFIERLPAFLE